MVKEITMSHLLNDQAKENWFEEALDMGLSDFDAEDYVDWMMDNGGLGDLHSYIFNYMRSKRVSHWSID
jgi:hypothetical protein|tara:strand:- start:104 stop:310 length:207 start_codon:yes stop_codon:yes gene_type:complete